MKKLLAVFFLLVLLINTKNAACNPADDLYRDIFFASGKERTPNVLIRFSLTSENVSIQEFSSILDKVIIRVFTEDIVLDFEDGLVLAAEALRRDRYFNHSILYLQKAAFIARQLNDPGKEADRFRRISGIAWENGRYYLSLENGIRALLYFERHADIDQLRMGYLYNTIALNYRALGQYDEALSYFNKAIASLEIEGNIPMLGVIYSNIGRLFFLKEDYSSALEYFQRGIELELQSENRRPLGRSYTSVGELYFILDEADSTMKYLKKAIDIQEEINDKVGLSRTFSVLGFIRKKENNIRASLENYRKSIDLAKEQDALEELRVALKGISRVYAVVGDYGNAYTYYLRYSEIQSQQFDISHQSDINQLEERIKMEEKEREIQSLMLARQKSITWFSIALAIMALFSAFLFFVLYRLKNSSLQTLSIQSETISHQKNELLKLNEDLILAKDKAEEADKLKSVFLANMSHEIRTPMNAIIGFSGLLSESNISENDRKMFVDIVQSNSKTLMQLIDDIIDFSRIEAGQLTITSREVDVDQVLEEIYLQFYNRMSDKNEKDLVLSFTKPSNLKNCRILADPSRISQVLSNLISNAIKFTPSGVIEFGYSITNGESDPQVRFYVRDTGIGITPEKQRVIFDRFRQGDEGITRPFEGTGLGLSIAKGIVEMMEGTIWVESIVNQGSTFYFSIPYKPVVKSTVKSDEQEIRPEDFSLKGRKILIAEDESYNYIFLEKLLKKTDTKIYWAKDGRESVEIVKNHPDIELILMDIKLPVMSGLEATREIRKFNQSVVIIAQTAYAMDEDKQKCFIAGCNDYLAKPIEINKFYSLLNKYLG
jgi:signal transduction histidine kinase/CheY-like chemotaxis protein/Tfp pilus assembly protein PilF